MRLSRGDCDAQYFRVYSNYTACMSRGWLRRVLRLCTRLRLVGRQRVFSMKPGVKEFERNGEQRQREECKANRVAAPRSEVLLVVRSSHRLQIPGRKGNATPYLDEQACTDAAQVGGECCASCRVVGAAESPTNKSLPRCLVLDLRALPG